MFCRYLQIPGMYMDGLDSPYIISSILPDLSKPNFYAVVVADAGWNGGNFAPIRQYAKVFINKAR